VNSAEAAEKPNKISEATINSEGWMTKTHLPLWKQITAHIQ